MMILRRIALFIACCLWMVCSQAAEVFHDASGHTINASQFKNKWVIINYWAPWCDICLREIPELNNFYLHNKNKNVLIYGVNYDHPDAAELKQSASTLGISYPVLVEDPNHLWDLGYFDVIPVTFVINPQGKIARKIIGPTTEEVLLEIIHSPQQNS
jgi:thiol-disulfide isomerase/thioredoxin